jgi:hypothetical protein
MHAATGLMNASDSGLEVVVSRMETCSLIRFRGRTFICGHGGSHHRPRIQAIAKGFFKRFRNDLLSATFC